jgi:hypothetical protein
MPAVFISLGWLVTGALAMVSALLLLLATSYPDFFSQAQKRASPAKSGIKNFVFMMFFWLV